MADVTGVLAPDEARERWQRLSRTAQDRSVTSVRPSRRTRPRTAAEDHVDPAEGT